MKRPGPTPSFGRSLSRLESLTPGTTGLGFSSPSSNLSPSFSLPFLPPSRLPSLSSFLKLKIAGNCLLKKVHLYFHREDIGFPQQNLSAPEGFAEEEPLQTLCPPPTLRTHPLKLTAPAPPAARPHRGPTGNLSPSTAFSGLPGFPPICSRHI